MEDNTKGLRKYLNEKHYAHPIEYFLTSSIDYMDVKCARCGNDCLVEFWGHKDDSVFNELRFICETCGEDIRFKFEKLRDISKEN